MKTGFRGTFVISWAQTEVDGFRAERLDAISVGSTWSWHGEVVRVDGPGDVLRLGQANGDEINRKRAARTVRRLVGHALENTGGLGPAGKFVKDMQSDPVIDHDIVVTDGRRSYTMTLIEIGSGRSPLLMFVDDIPPRDHDLWVVRHRLEVLQRHTPSSPATGGVICFTPGTWISTPNGGCRVEDLCEGDLVQTKDNGADAIQWIGRRHMTGARLFAMPGLRPIRLRSNALGDGRPDADLLVSPDHRMLVQGAVARALFNTPEVLVSARDLVNNNSITVDLAAREVTYIHLLLPRHQILFANGLQTESFHPASAALSTLDETDRLRLIARFPVLAEDPHHYGHFARRSLTPPEAAILMREAA